MTGPFDSELAAVGCEVAVGCDVVALDEIATSLQRFGDRFLRRVYTADEVRECLGANRIERLAARFAAKEAVIKAFADPAAPMPLTDIAVLRAGDLPTLALTGLVAEHAHRHGWLQTSVSLSHTDCHAMATVAVLRRAVSQGS
ncbi:Holo-[acyl-carrier-protein] synthase [Mycolicibacterium phlei]|uniref:Holo-[acyl-carrier-protein] synthase n=2 Tax=Mycolicibacterium TaxID=1866885 RepID=A0A5N5URH1_MYCPH|nr:holo-ACP synthase [Mycolicibacterium phlei]VEG08175.1 Holo-[acyl-carrier-protein] synthase [Mycobacteroides chelonae]AMO60053.1 Holo-[acyl-carrier-protein] synthase [Mycolicibacterium phlei]KAB7751717.1 ACP synthase [Mycolicibacterium phlei DSM 43239 = CCUG 21000]KXW60302.1 ACP synthase [Mycolicibacterium phlei DSM 43239 = CCUG 21000]KXW65941.1 hypothetical protein MPHL43070_21395 [Mycolicibacterium phlei DSM 43070]